MVAADLLGDGAERSRRVETGMVHNGIESH